MGGGVGLVILRVGDFFHLVIRILVLCILVLGC